MEQKIWGETPDHESVVRYTIRNQSGSYFVTMNYGANLLELHVPDRDGRLDDVVLGFQDLDSYWVNDPCFGCLVAPYANRIGNAAFTLEGTTYHLDPNDHEHNTLHSGFHGLHHCIWDVSAWDSNSITYSIRKADMECGFPGNVDLSVTYSLSDDNALSIHYHAVSDQDTVLNPTNHSYFNLAGQGSGSILDQEVWIDSDSFLPTDEEQIPHGEILSVTGTPMDFRTPRTPGENFTNYNYDPIRIGHGYDHNYVLKTTRGTQSLVSSLEDDRTGRKMEIYTDLPGLQIYTGNWLSADPVGKNGAKYGPGAGVAFETQFFPNAVNIPSFEQPLLKKGESFDSTTTYKFTTV